MSLLIQNIKSLILASDQASARALARGTAMNELPTVDDAYVLIDNGKIKDWGSMDNAPKRAHEIIDATGRFVLPTWCDSHTHLVFAASRESEFEDRIKGLSYQEIAERGGGILNSAKRLQDTDFELLLEQAKKRLDEVIRMGTGAIEIKSGYGLSVEAELKMLSVIKALKAIAPIPIKATFLGAHAFPTRYKAHPNAYVQLLIHEMLPKIAAEGLADYVDAFCEKGFFSVEQTAKVIKAAAQYGLRPKIHTNQFNSMGGIEMAVEHQALSVDHLEVLNDEEITCLLNSQTVPTLLPSASFFLNDHYAPARKMIDAGLGVALATDYNPGSTPSGKMAFVLSLACIKMKMLPNEAIQAATLNGACALELQNLLGSITRGKLANLIISKAIPSLAYIPYAFGSDVIDKVLINGKEYPSSLKGRVGL